MIKLERRGERRNMLSDTNSALIHNLKGNISKILSLNATILRDEEKSGLEGVYAAIDSLILSERGNSDFITFREDLVLHLKYLRGTRKMAIKKKIIPKIEETLEKVGGDYNE